jgi:hypothetical protein
LILMELAECRRQLSKRRESAIADRDSRTRLTDSGPSQKSDLNTSVQQESFSAGREGRQT